MIKRNVSERFIRKIEPNIICPRRHLIFAKLIVGAILWQELSIQCYYFTHYQMHGQSSCHFATMTSVNMSDYTTKVLLASTVNMLTNVTQSTNLLHYRKYDSHTQICIGLYLFSLSRVVSLLNIHYQHCL